jgi:hypothetical protein
VKFNWRYVVEGVIEAPSREIVQAAVINQISLATNLTMGLKGFRVDAEPAQLIETPAIAFDANVRRPR